MAPRSRSLSSTDQDREALRGNLEQDISRHILSTLGAKLHHEHGVHG